MQVVHRYNVYQYNVCIVKRMMQCFLLILFYHYEKDDALPSMLLGMLQAFISSFPKWVA